MSNDKNTRIGKVGSTSRTKALEETEAVSGVGAVKEVGKVDAVKAIMGTNSVDSVGRVVTKSEHAQIIKLINEEAESFFQESQIPKGKRKIIKDAVVMAVDAGLILKEEEE